MRDSSTKPEETLEGLLAQELEPLSEERPPRTTEAKLHRLGDIAGFAALGFCFTLAARAFTLSGSTGSLAAALLLPWLFWLGWFRSYGFERHSTAAHRTR